MVHDYSRRYSRVVGRRQAVSKKRFPGGSFWLSRALGTVMMLGVVAGIGFSLWVNWRIEITLDELAAATTYKGQLVGKNGKLRQERQKLLAEETVLARAAELGLFPPASGQIRHQ